MEYVEQAVTSGGTCNFNYIQMGQLQQHVQNAVIKLTGTISGNSIVTIPDSMKKFGFIDN